MRGRRPRALAITPEDDQPLRRIARSQGTPWFQARRARIVLAIAGGWSDRGAFIEHVRAAGLEYNRLDAHPFEWTWTNQNMRNWFDRHSN